MGLRTDQHNIMQSGIEIQYKVEGQLMNIVLEVAMGRPDY